MSLPFDAVLRAQDSEGDHDDDDDEWARIAARVVVARPPSRRFSSDPAAPRVAASPRRDRVRALTQWFERLSTRREEAGPTEGAGEETEFLRHQVAQERAQKAALEHMVGSLRNALTFSKRKVDEQNAAIERLEGEVRIAHSLAPCLKEIVSST